MHYQLTDAWNEPKGPQQPHPPICIGGSGEKCTLRTTARFAQHWNSLEATPDDFAHKVSVLHAHCADLGRDPSQILLSTHIEYDPKNPQATVDEIGAFAERGLGLAIVYLRPPHTVAAITSLANVLSAMA